MFAIVLVEFHNGKKVIFKDSYLHIIKIGKIWENGVGLNGI